MKISVIIPAYNAGKTLAATLGSLDNQSERPFEVIVVDDCSRDDSYKIAKKYTDNVIRNSINKGPAYSRNIGIKRSKGDIVAFIDSDCEAQRDWIKTIKDEINVSPVLMGNTKVRRYNYLSDSIAALGFPAGGIIGFEKIWKVSPEGFTEHISSCNFAAKRSVFEERGLFDESFPSAGGEDSEFSHRIIKKGDRIKFVKDMKVLHVPRKGIMSFIRWQILRGESNYHFKRKVKDVSGFVRLRLWSTKNIIFNYLFDPKIFMIVLLILASFALQMLGYFKARLEDN